ncbi:hypothetical protein [Enterovirga rhinocerotis]|uniref:Uncharacterized protein n=1 Tax=Enterovirga rhinocerotis TaxID=1339210 RepID=A0A4R7BXH4_9HYPH|nr:hypothetical protein [Enterovirga rhinocerotis]TDR88897.1 hypothetical protein EV668_3380 [Enterovirga rhinocerotis]
MSVPGSNKKPGPPNEGSRPSDGGEPVSGRKDKPSKQQEADEVNTPGDGALPSKGPGSDVDPGVG